MEKLVVFNYRNSEISEIEIVQVVNNIYQSVKKPVKYYFLDIEKNNLYQILKKDIPHCINL